MNRLPHRMRLLGAFSVISILVVSGIYLLGVQDDWADMLYEMR